MRLPSEPAISAVSVHTSRKMLRRGEEARAYLTYCSDLPSESRQASPLDVLSPDLSQAWQMPLPCLIGYLFDLDRPRRVPHGTRGGESEVDARPGNSSNRIGRRAKTTLLQLHSKGMLFGSDPLLLDRLRGHEQAWPAKELLPIFGPRFAKIRQTGALLASCRGLLKSVAQIRKFIATRRSVHGQTGS